MADNVNVKFLRGSSEDLKLINAPSDGVFYLTEDTHKLHVGILNESGTTKIYELNKDIIIETSKDNLESRDDLILNHFYYVMEENIVYIYRGIDDSGKKNFVQINPNIETLKRINAIEKGYLVSGSYGSELRDNLGNTIIFDCGGLE